MVFKEDVKNNIEQAILNTPTSRFTKEDWITFINTIIDDTTLTKRAFETPEELESVRDYFKKAEQEYNIQCEIHDDMDRLTLDLMHKLELQDLNEEEQLEVTKQLKDCREKRRVAKDTTMVLSPVIECMNLTNILNQLNVSIGEARKAYKKVSNERHYVPKYMSIEEYNGEKKGEELEQE